MSESHVPEKCDVLVVDDHARTRDSMVDILGCAGHQVRGCASAVEGLAQLDTVPYDVIITDLKMPGMNGLEFIRTLRQRGCDAQIIMVTAHASIASAVDAMRFGAFDYIEKPFTADQLEQLVMRAVRHGAVVEQRSCIPALCQPADMMVGSSQIMQRLRDKIRQVAATSETVLITGESGVGKELVAQAIHASSNRSAGALVSLNCPALSPQLMESELFGHERGSFTSADARRVGRFELADKGTILLDEVTEISLPLQAKLLRVLQEKSFERVGASETKFVDTRVLATTNRDLLAEVREGRFREDLYFRLAVVPLHVPALRERREDLPQLVGHFCALAAARLSRPVCRLDQNAEQLLFDYRWPGNIRELENIITRASVFAEDEEVTAQQLQPWLLDYQEDGTDRANRPGGMEDFPEHMNLQEMERRLIESTLDRFDGHRARTAQALGIGVRTLTNKLRSYGYAPREKSYARAA